MAHASHNQMVYITTPLLQRRQNDPDVQPS